MRGGLYRFMEGSERNNIKVGQKVSIVLKQDQRTGILTEGIVSRILTKSKFHPYGIKVQLESGEVGRVKQLEGEKKEDEKDTLIK